MRDAPAFIIGLLLLFSRARATMGQTHFGALPQADTLIITRNGSALSGAMLFGIGSIKCFMTSEQILKFAVMQVEGGWF